MLKESYGNHLKNLKLKCINNNFIILVMEIIQNLVQIIVYFPFWITYFVKKPEYSFDSAMDDFDYTALLTVPLRQWRSTASKSGPANKTCKP